jgi:hypothetical protein
VNYEESRIGSRDEIHINGRPATTFHLFERNDDVFIHIGVFAVDDHRRSREQLIDGALDQLILS